VGRATAEAHRGVRIRVGISGWIPPAEEVPIRASGRLRSRTRRPRRQRFLFADDGGSLWPAPFSALRGDNCSCGSP
jgi:hypothetical protein